jgi:hypothetical protein
MAGDGGVDTGIVISNKDIAPSSEMDIQEVQRQIIERVSQLLQDPQALTLTYPNEYAHVVATQGVDADYDHGSKVRFAMLKKSGFLGRDELCVAFVDNISEEHPVSMGAGFVQKNQGKRSEHEVAVMRFLQSPMERLKGGGTLMQLVLSDTDPTFTGTSSKKGEVYPNRIKSDIPTFAEHWESGNAQLAGLMMYDASSRDLEFASQDYRDILHALKNYKIDSNLTAKVAKSEDRIKLAKSGSEPVNITPRAKALTGS